MSFPQHYQRLINQIVALCPAPDKFAHMSAGLLFWLLAAIVLRKPLHSRWPLVVVIALEIANEYVDYLAHGSWRWSDTAMDMVATWFWPFVLAFCLSRMRWLRGGRA